MGLLMVAKVKCMKKAGPMRKYWFLGIYVSATGFRLF